MKANDAFRRPINFMKRILCILSGDRKSCSKTLIRFAMYFLFCLLKNTHAHRFLPTYMIWNQFKWAKVSFEGRAHERNLHFVVFIFFKYFIIFVLVVCKCYLYIFDVHLTAPARSLPLDQEALQLFTFDKYASNHKLFAVQMQSLA